MSQSWKNLLLVAALMVPMGFLSACQSDGDSSTSDGPALATPVEVVEGVTGSSGILDKKGAFLFKSQKDLDAMGASSLYPGEVDFDQYDMVVLAMGEQNTGGHWVRITSISQVGKDLFVAGIANRPADDAVTTQALEYPYHAVLINKTSATLAVAEVEGVTGESPESLMPEE